MRTYRPGQVPDNPASVPGFLRQETANIQRAANAADPFNELQTLTAAPSKVREGMVVLADGTNWNPGGGVGYYGYVGGSWRKFGMSGPAFSAYQSVLQSVPNITFTKLQLQAEEFDTDNAFDSATNYRFQPTVAGHYMVLGGVGFNGIGGIGCVIYKNGAAYKRGVLHAPAVASYNVTVAALVQMNGSTDYVEMFVYQASGAAANTAPGADLTYFQGHLARAT